MDLKNEIRGLLHKGYTVINDLNKSADLIEKQTLLKQNGLNSQNQAKELIRNLHELVNAFDHRLQNLLCKTVNEKMEILEIHSDEMIQCVDYISNLCMNAENLIKEDNIQLVKSFGAELKAEFLKSLKDCRELKLVDYETFTSIDLEVDLSGLYKNPLVNIVSWNHRCLEKTIVHSLHFGCVDEVMLSPSLNQASFKKYMHDSDSHSESSASQPRSALFSKPDNITNAKNNVEMIKKSKLALDTATKAVSAKEDIQDLKSAFKLNVSLSDCPVKFEQNCSSFSSRNLNSSKAESQSLKTEQSISFGSRKTEQSTSFDSRKCFIATNSSEFEQNCSSFSSRNLNSSKAESHSLKTEQFTTFGSRKTEQSSSFDSRKSFIATNSPEFEQNFNSFSSRNLNSSKAESQSLKTEQPTTFGSRKTEQSTSFDSRKSFIATNSSEFEQNCSSFSSRNLNSSKAESQSLKTEQSTTFGSRKTELSTSFDSEKSFIATNFPEFEQNCSSFSSRNLNFNNAESQSLVTEPSTSLGSRKTEQFTSFDSRKTFIATNSPEETAQLHVSKNKICDFTTSKIKTEEISYNIMDSWCSLSLEPVKMTFDLRTVLPSESSRIPEILGECVETITGGTRTTFSFPIGVTVTADGLVVIADTGNNMVKVMDNNMLILTIGDNDGVTFVRPSAVVTDTDGHIYVKDDFCIQIFDGKGQLLQTVGKTSFRRPYGLALIKHEKNESSLVVIDAGRTRSTVYKYLIKEDKLEAYPYYAPLEYNLPFSKVRFLAVHNNTMLVSDLGASTMYLSFLNGTTMKAFGGYGSGLGQFKEPSGITVDAVGNWIVGDSKNNRIQVFTNDGDLLAVMKLSSPIRRPSGIHLTSDGRLYVINYLDSVINVYKLCQ